jgi:hypothetical protein
MCALTSHTIGFGVLARVRSASSLAVSLAAGVRPSHRQVTTDNDDNNSRSVARQWVMPALLTATRCAAASWPAVATTAVPDAVLVARWRRVWAFDALTAPASMSSRLIIETMQFDARVSVLAIWRNGVEVMLPCTASRYDDDDSHLVQHRFAAELVFDATSNDNTLSLDVCCWRLQTAATASSAIAFDTPQSMLLRLTQIVERALLDISDVSEPVQRIFAYVG